mmetsp:Transcript_33564/g.37690  ORF Transcript_33564/g.37690 Transcript_33564/m.37690 type:complete len:442 (-) Transcript_33564:339-1664(-)
MKRNLKALAMGFLDDVFNPKKKNQKKQGNKSGNINNENRLANLGKSLQKNFTGGQQHNTFHGQGQSLGGSKPGDVIDIILSNPGPLGVRVEKRSNNNASAIVNQVVPGSQAEAAGLRRGDVLCFSGSEGQHEVQFDMFLQIAASTQRPIHLEARRFQESTKKAAASTGGSGSADAEARRKAMIEAAVAREKAHNKKTKKIKYVTKSTTLLNKQQLAEQAANNTGNTFTENELQPQTEASRQAAAAAKRDEQQLANELGYNPYATNKSTAGQARSATVTTQHGEVNANAGDGRSIPVVTPPSNPTSAVAPEFEEYPVPEEFEEALVTVISNSDSEASKTGLKIARTLIVNATTKGQQEDEEAGAKFRKVRLANAKIKKALVDVPGNIQLMLSVGFQLVESSDDSLLMFPSPSPTLLNIYDGYQQPVWLPTALRKMEQQEKLL